MVDAYAPKGAMRIKSSQVKSSQDENMVKLSEFAGFEVHHEL